MVIAGAAWKEKPFCNQLQLTGLITEFLWYFMYFELIKISVFSKAQTSHPPVLTEKFLKEIYWLQLSVILLKHFLILFVSSAHSHSRKERERRPQVVRRSAPDSGVLIRLKAQMAEVRSKMSDVKSQVMEARGSAEPRPGPSGAFSVEEVPSHHADSDSCRKPSELDLLGRAAAARSRPCRPGEKIC